MQIAGGAGTGRSLVIAIQKGLVTTFSVCFCSEGLSFGRKSLQGTLPCEHREGGKDPGEQRTPRSSCAGQGTRGRPGPRGAGGELCLWLSCCGAAPASAGTPCLRLKFSLPANRRCGRASFQAKGEACGSLISRRVSGTSGPSLRCWHGSVRPGAAGSNWGLPTLAAPSGSAAPSPESCQEGPSCCPPASPTPGSPLPAAGAAVDPGPTAPGWPPTAGGDFPERKYPSAFDILARFSEAKSADLAPCSMGTSLSFCSCLHLETPLKNCAGVDLTPRGRQQARHWDHNSAYVCFV